MPRKPARKNLRYVKQRRDGRWEVRVPIAKGSSDRPSYYAEDADGARTIRDRLLKVKDQTGRLDAAVVTLAEWLDHWYQATIINSQKLAPRTKADHAQSLPLLKAVLGSYKLSDLRKSVLQAGMDRIGSGGIALPSERGNGTSTRVTRPMGANTWHRYFSSLNKALRLAVADGVLLGNPAKEVEKPQRPASIGKALSDAEAMRLRDALTGSDEGLALKLMLVTGMRKGEVMALQWDCLDFDSRLLTVKRAACADPFKGRDERGRIAWIIRDVTKTKRSRQILVPQALLDDLHDHRNGQRRRIAEAKGAWHNPNLVFSDAAGEMYREYRLTYVLNAALKSAGLSHCRVYDLRHTAGTRLLSATKDVKATADYLGHDERMLLQKYAKVLSAQKQAIDRANEEFLQAK